MHGPPQPPNHAKLLPFLSFLLVSFRLSSLLFVRAAVATPIGWARRLGLVCGLECRLEAWAAAAAGFTPGDPRPSHTLTAKGHTPLTRPSQPMCDVATLTLGAPRGIGASPPRAEGAHGRVENPRGGAQGPLVGPRSQNCSLCRASPHYSAGLTNAAAAHALAVAHSSHALAAAALAATVAASALCGGPRSRVRVSKITKTLTGHPPNSPYALGQAFVLLNPQSVTLVIERSVSKSQHPPEQV